MGNLVHELQGFTMKSQLKQEGRGRRGRRGESRDGEGDSLGERLQETERERP